MTSSNPFVTVGMVTYKSSPYVRMAIESVLASSYTNFELIISDDCSRDETWDIISEYKDPRIRAYRNEKNIGEYPNRNKCIDLAKGKYFIFIDGDDVLYPHGLDFLVKMMERFPESGMAITKNYINNILYPCELTPEMTMNIEYLGSSLLGVSFVSTFFRLDCLKSSGGLSNKYIAGDEFIRLKVASRFNTLLVNYGVSWHRETPGQATSSKLARFVGSAELIKMKVELFKGNKIPLSKNDFNLFYKMTAGSFWRILIRQLLKFRFLHFWRLISISGIKISDIKYLLVKTQNQSILREFQPEEPLTKDFFRSPFASSL